MGFKTLLMLITAIWPHVIQCIVFLPDGSECDTRNEEHRVGVRCQKESETSRIRSDQVTKGHLGLMCGFASDTAFFLKEVGSNNIEFANNDGMFETVGNVEYVVVFAATQVIKASTRTWTHIGILKEIETLVKEYPATIYEYGIRYNHILGTVHQVIFNSWNRGIRITTLHSYPMGDTATGLKYGRTVLTKGLADAADASKWYQHYIYEEGDTYRTSNGEADHVLIFVRMM